ncbi:hypothetical protein RQP46_011276 [Phenoliferia psychrophenolica]
MDSTMDMKLDVSHLEHNSRGEDGSSTLTYVRGSVAEKALLRKIDRRILPTLWIMYVFNYLDRTNIGNAKVGGMGEALGLTSSDYSLSLSIFFIGAISVAAKGVSTLGGLLALRFMLGVVEAGFFSSGTISYFIPTLTTSLGYQGRDAQFMTIPIYVVSLVISLAVGYNADRTNQKALHFVCACIAGAASFVVLYLSYMITQFEGREKRAVSIAIINGLGGLASIYGSFIWPSETAPRYLAGFATTTGLIVAAGAVMLLFQYKYGSLTFATRTSSDEPGDATGKA